MTLEDALSSGHEAAALSAYALLPPEARAAAAALALRLGRPRLAAGWAAADGLTLAAALLRLGQAARALDVLAPLPDQARPALLRARARWQQALGQAVEPPWGESRAALHARDLARREGDTPALIAAATLSAEQLLGEPYTALRVLAEGLKVAELGGEAADAHLLSVLAHVQLRLGGPKGQRTAARALERSLPRSPARVLALLALRRGAEAMAEAQDGELAGVWWQPVHH